MSRGPDRYFVLGNPVAHSRSPFIHNAFAQQTGQDLVYERRLCAMDEFAAAVTALAQDTQGGPVRGCNVTVPFKFDVPALAARVTARAALAGAANALRFDPEGWLADNTDGVGLLRDLQVNQGLQLSGRRVLLVGAGGAGAGVLGPLLQAQPDLLCVANRSLDKANALVARHAALADACAVNLAALSLSELPAWLASRHGTPFDLLINASASSLGGAALPVPVQALAPGCSVVDLMYGSAAEPFLDWARAHGAAHTADGLGMLVEQAAEAFELWRGVRPLTAPVLAALRSQLAESR